MTQSEYISDDLSLREVVDVISQIEEQSEDIFNSQSESYSFQIFIDYKLAKENLLTGPTIKPLEENFRDAESLQDYITAVYKKNLELCTIDSKDLFPSEKNQMISQNLPHPEKTTFNTALLTVKESEGGEIGADLVLEGQLDSEYFFNNSKGLKTKSNKLDEKHFYRVYFSFLWQNPNDVEDIFNIEEKTLINKIKDKITG